MLHSYSSTGDMAIVHCFPDLSFSRMFKGEAELRGAFNVDLSCHREHIQIERHLYFGFKLIVIMLTLTNIKIYGIRYNLSHTRENLSYRRFLVFGCVSV